MSPEEANECPGGRKTLILFQAFARPAMAPEGPIRAQDLRMRAEKPPYLRRRPTR